MRTYKMTISYDGTRYQGWQRQAMTDNTIQHILEWTIGRMVGYRVQVDGSGRTDSGVHARGQVASVKLSKLYDVEDLKDALNRSLPEDIRIIRVELVRNGFHARKYCYHYPVKLDIEAMRDAADYLVGTKDFTSFTDNRETRDTIRRIYSIKVVRAGDKVRITYYGSGFMYHMARILTGTLIEVGAGKREASNLPLVLEAKDRSMAGFLAPARGLFLRKVYY